MKEKQLVADVQKRMQKLEPGAEFPQALKIAWNRLLEFWRVKKSNFPYKAAK